MAWIAGVDGCRGGWVAALEETGSRARVALVVSELGSLLAARPELQVIAVDVPIGLPEQGPRSCDREARRRLGRGAGPRVFPAPSRAVLGASTYTDACRKSERAGGKRISRQVWGILPKIAEADALPRRALEQRVFEAHPELSFMCIAATRSALPPKRDARGKTLRRRALARAFPGLDLRALALPGSLAREDDLFDAFALLWTARRLLSGEAESLPATPPRDAKGRRMAIHV